MKSLGFPTFTHEFEETGRSTNPDGTTSVTFRRDHCALTVTYNRPSADALEKFIISWQEILLTLVDLPDPSESHHAD
ncbi:hypothetical protein [Ferroacidibacillus organovorans]|uniref:Uncharacterized protein n=1 Tax=Ferroacidibacillus organovorans TaxID=1765683 RepID=A0A1V4EVZ9_9BACL|nr:hypothetical protein [Ferroacidibacillus organovorans]OPG17117.1 hypothetical protein B2M26_03145 [Ferroacidibacillus organovorans]